MRYGIRPAKVEQFQRLWKAGDRRVAVVKLAPRRLASARCCIPAQHPERFGNYFLGGYCLNIFCTDCSVCFSSPFCEFDTLSTVACPRQTRCFWATSYRSTVSMPIVRGCSVVTAVSE